MIGKKYSDIRSKVYDGDSQNQSCKTCYGLLVFLIGTHKKFVCPDVKKTMFITLVIFHEDKCHLCHSTIPFFGEVISVKYSIYEIEIVKLLS